MQVLDAWSQRYETQRLSVLLVENERMVATLLADYSPGSYNVRSVLTGEDAHAGVVRRPVS